MQLPYRPAILLVSVALLSACGKGMGDLEEWVTEVKARKPAAIEPIPQIKQYETFAYEPGTRRDPFSTLEPQRQQAANGPRPDLNRNKEPLEEFPIDALRMLGTINSGGSTYALVRAPDGVVHRVTLKNHLGQNYGEITAISEGEVSLQELVPDGFGGWIQRPASLALAEQ
ncbi:MAG TPA: pilus assembly protein PilP [Solimonas sp.]|nr:pilus assembly protein PilP [Solimonas sp.]